MLALLLSLALVAQDPVPFPAPTIDAQNGRLRPKTGHVYYRSKVALTIGAAEEFAERLEGRLVSIEDEAEHSWLSQAFARNGFWLGLRAPFTEWDSGVRVDFTAWFDGQPGDSMQYAQMWRPWKGSPGWGSIGAQHHRRGFALVEIEGRPLTEASGKDAEIASPSEPPDPALRRRASLVIAAPGLLADDIDRRRMPRLHALRERSCSSGAAWCAWEPHGWEALAAALWGAAPATSGLAFGDLKYAGSSPQLPFVGLVEVLSPETTTFWWSDHIPYTSPFLARMKVDVRLSLDPSKAAGQERLDKVLSDVVSRPAPIVAAVVLSHVDGTALVELEGKERAPALERIDGIIGDLLDRIDARGQREDEEWLIAVSGTVGPSGWRLDEGRRRPKGAEGAPLIVAVDGVEPRALDLVPITSIAPTVIRHQGLDTVTDQMWAGAPIQFEPPAGVDVNLLQNGDCEAPGAHRGESAARQPGVRGWVAEGGASSVASADMPILRRPPGAAPDAPFDAGRASFALPRRGSLLAQSVDLSAQAQDIGAGRRRFEFSAVLGAPGQAPTPGARLEWFDRKGKLVGGEQLEPLKPAEKIKASDERSAHGIAGWFVRSVDGKVPARAVRARVWLHNASSADERAFADGVSLVLRVRGR